jgi:hypothetical protein
VFTRAHGSGTAALSDQGGGSSILIGAGPVVTQMRTFGPNHVELVGAVSTVHALYVDYDAGTLASSWRMLDLPCQGTAGWSMIDAVAHPAAFGGDTLVYGRVLCSTGVNTVVARIANVAATSAQVVWWRVVEAGDQCNQGPVPCPQMMLAYDEAMLDHALLVTPLRWFYPLRLSDGTLRLPGDSMASFGTPYPLPSTYRGGVLRHPRLVGFGEAAPFDATKGVTSMLFDGIFSGDFD